MTAQNTDRDVPTDIYESPEEAKKPSVPRIVFSSVIWTVIFGLVALWFGNILIIIGAWYLFSVNPDDDVRRKIRMIIVGVYCLALFLLNMIIIPELVDEYFGALDPLAKYSQVWAVLAFIKLIVAVGIILRLPRLFSPKYIKVYIAKKQNRIADRVEEISSIRQLTSEKSDED